MLCYCIEKSLKNNCTIVFNTNMKMVFKNCIDENNNEIWSEIAHFSSFLLNFSGFVLTKLNVSAVYSRKKQHTLRIRLNQSADDRSLLKKLCLRIVPWLQHNFIKCRVQLQSLRVGLKPWFFVFPHNLSGIFDFSKKSIINWLDGRIMTNHYL